MNIFECNFKVFLIKDISKEDVQEAISKLIDKSFYKNESLKDFHEENRIKGYCFNSLYPISINKDYSEGEIYNFQIRCVGEELKNHFVKFLTNEYTTSIKALTCESKSILKKPIDRIYSITPVVIKISDVEKTEYWRNKHNEEDFFEYIRENSIKKYEVLTGEKVDRSLRIFTYERIDNRTPIATNFKGRKMLGDKITLTVDTGIEAQNIAYVLLGTGIGDMSPRGYGYMNYQYIK